MIDNNNNDNKNNDDYIDFENLEYIMKNVIKRLKNKKGNI